MTASELDVELTHVSKSFGMVRAVDDVSFGVGRGEFFSLLGPSGCGKTTIMRMISGFEAPTSGSLKIRGQDVAAQPPFRRPTNMVFQHLALFPHMTVAQNIAFGLEMERLPKAEIGRRVGSALELVHLAGFDRRRVSQLSGGQRQRVAIARALVKRPAVLLLDEPLGALDLKLREEMQLELKRIQREIGTTFVYVTHDQKEAITMSDRIAVINGGRIEQLDTVSAIYERPRTAFVAGFIGETNLLRGRLVEAGGETATVAVGEARLAVRPEAPLPRDTEVLVSLRPEKIRLGPPLPETANRLDGTVESIVYLGSHTRYRVQVPGVGGLDVDVQNAEPAAPHEAGRPVTLGWQPAAAVVIPQPSGRAE
ncbi:spermidine/putrescine transport system ATP-binding protein [Tistlia consotensis]|uniref:Spermidine/putrescine import ATP-binding protein PotA n=1 Tax=Tistlia consotensis USBA 355 TaxID=560819 RepID=A0A1Y6B962_9PROT|nr:ABC transporter ATP-binding protein [Tistlia consotensis]SME98020.1 spermidine/putrescine transport system ATP-binding protein [Tistlia consotensis USBA 355]SNR57414.1 spermidine/putrescine transport system ATP-binding protein [Tistlia consotensis]